LALSFCETEGTPNPGRSFPHWPLSMVGSRICETLFRFQPCLGSPRREPILPSDSAPRFALVRYPLEPGWPVLLRAFGVIRPRARGPCARAHCLRARLHLLVFRYLGTSWRLIALQTASSLRRHSGFCPSVSLFMRGSALEAPLPSVHDDEGAPVSVWRLV
jgi:hypothetical protein